MATITADKLGSDAITTSTFTASTPAGDEIAFSNYQRGILVFIDNGHASPITVDVVPTVSSKITQTEGKVTKPTLSLAVSNGAKATIFIPAASMSYYKNASNRIPISYTSGNAALTVRALEI